MKVAVLSLTVCPATEAIIKYFNEKGFYIDCVIIEKNFRKKFSKSEIEYRKAHDKFNRKTKKYSFFRRLARRAWDFSPLWIKEFIQKNIYFFPFLNIFSLKKFCKKRNINVFEVKNHSSEKTKNIILNRGIDYLLMVSSNWLLKEPIISIKNSKIINAHSGWLPKHKGLDSIPWSLKENDKVGLTTHFIDSGIDSGAILRFYGVKIEKGDNLNAIHKKVGNLQPIAFYDTLIGLERNDITPQNQDDKYRPHFPMSFNELWELEKKLTAHNRVGG
jgi:folate-dependent phosphoribosylglycinamide formyltransferase PurN